MQAARACWAPLRLDFGSFACCPARLQQLLADTVEQLKSLPTSHPQRYAMLLQGLIKQGIKQLGEKDVVVTARRDDLSLVKAALDALKRDADLAGTTLAVKETTFLPATWCVCAWRALHTPCTGVEQGMRVCAALAA